ncbi:AAA family ATPase [Streptomyces sp. NPDC051840]|uniref:uridine kinase family protein n=1 Tax=Streptomyces sp. NPDC051840 TaxID=3154752 RepID=UPI003430BC34
MSQAAEEVAAVVAARRRTGVALVALDGMGGSGKSTLAAALAELCGAAVVHGDDFYRPMDPGIRAALSPQEGYHRYFDWQRLRAEVLAPLTAGRDAVYRRYDWDAGDLATDESRRVTASGVVVVEGVYTARPELARYYDLLVYVDTPPEESMRRLRARGEHDSPIDWELRWRMAEEHYLSVTRLRHRSDLTVAGH